MPKILLSSCAVNDQAKMYFHESITGAGNTGGSSLRAIKGVNWDKKFVIEYRSKDMI